MEGLYIKATNPGIDVISLKPSIFIKFSLKKIDKYVIHKCASICKERSNQKNKKGVHVIYTQISNVTIDETDRIGTVSVRGALKICL